MKVFDATPGASSKDGAAGIRTAELGDAASPWYRRPGVLMAAAALTAGVGIVVSGPGEPSTAPGGTTGTSNPWSPSFSLMATEWWEPTPEPPPAAAPPAAPPAQAPPRAAPRPVAPVEVAPPPPPPSQLVLSFDDPLTAAFVSITNNANAVGCVYRTVAVAGTAAAVGYSADHPITVTGSEVARIPQGSADGPPTGSTFHITVTCDNGLSTSVEKVY